MLARRFRLGAPTLLAFALVFAACGSGTTDVPPPPGSAALAVPLETNFASTGTVGGPFEPGSTSYELTNIGTADLSWSSAVSQSWITLSPSSGRIVPLGAQAVTVTLNQAAQALAAGTHTATVQFSNLSNSIGDTSREVTLVVSEPGTPLMNCALRSSGTAPMSVLFDPIGTQSGVVQPTSGNHADLTYRWDYGEPSSGTWPHTGKSRNVSHGWVGGHVYSTPGTYRATLQVTDATGTSHTYIQDITVADPAVTYAEATYFLAANGSDSNPGSQAQPFATLARAFQSLQNRTTPARLRIRAGDAFTASSQLATGTTEHPVLIDSYGTGALPIISFTGGTTGIAFSADHCALQGIKLLNISTSAPSWTPGVQIVDTATGTTVLGCHIADFGMNVNCAGEQSVVAECELLYAREYGLWVARNSSGMKQIAALGNRFDNLLPPANNLFGSHLIRCYTNKSLFANNLFQRVETARHALKMVGGAPSNTFRWNLIADNEFESECSWVVAIGPQNAESNEHIEDTMVTGNHFRCGDASLPIAAMDKRITVTNNLFEARNNTLVHVFQRGIGPMPTGVRIEHNTAYRHTGSPLYFVTANSGDQTLLRYNIAFCRQGTVQAPNGTFSASNNLFTDPAFVDPANGNLALTAGSSAVDAATGSTQRVDFAGQTRTATAAPDLGALERNP